MNLDHLNPHRSLTLFCGRLIKVGDCMVNRSTRRSCWRLALALLMGYGVIPSLQAQTSPVSAYSTSSRSSLLPISSISSSSTNASCTLQNSTCTQGPATRLISGQSVTRNCWQYQQTYQCASPTVSNDCQSLVNQGCSPIGSVCTDQSTNGQCLLSELTYRCSITTGAPSVVTQCPSQSFCLSDQCFDSGHPNNSDFAKASTLLEATREAGHYMDPQTLSLFSGAANQCQKKLFGLVNCCQSSGSNGAMFTDLNLILAAGGKAVGALGSTYTYDALFASDAPQWVLSGFSSLFSAGGGSSALAALAAGDLSAPLFIESLVPGPWSLAIMAIELSGLFDCPQSAQTLVMKRDNRLCESLGSYCSSRIPLINVCIETTQSYCCFKSRLARLINEQGRAQLQKSWGSAKSPDCSGFSLNQLQALNFATMDLSEFYAEIAPTLPSLSTLQNTASQKITPH